MQHIAKPPCNLMPIHGLDDYFVVVKGKNSDVNVTLIITDRPPLPLSVKNGENSTLGMALALTQTMNPVDSIQVKASQTAQFDLPGRATRALPGPKEQIPAAELEELGMSHTRRQPPPSGNFICTFSICP